MIAIVGVMLGVFFMQQLFWMHNFQKLVNKLMSRDYAEYQASKRLSEPEQPKFKVPDMSHVPEDLRVLQGIVG